MMKTINYRLSGKPHSIDDCLDLCRKEKLDRVVIEIDWENDFLDFDLFRRLLLRSTWYLPRRSFSCETTLGGYLLSETRKKKRIAIDRANEKLRLLLAKIQQKGINPQASGRITLDALKVVENDV